MDLKALHEQALERFKLVVEVERDQRHREEAALKFKQGDQWPDDIKTARAGMPASGTQPQVPARPMLTIRTLDQPIAQVVNQGRQAELAIQISPRKDASIEDAEVFEGLVRNIEHESHAQSAYLWAYERAVIAGRGFFRINKQYADTESGFDQVLTIDRILNQASVYLDPFAQQADWSDIEWAFVTEDLSAARYTREFGTSKLATDGVDEQVLVSTDNPIQPWILRNSNSKDDPEAVWGYRIAEYWFKTYDVSEEVDTAVEEGEEPRRREIRTPKVMWAKLNGVEFLDPPQEWDGPDIPLVPVIGSEYNVEGKRAFQGMVEPAMGSCRMINYMASSLAEQAGLASRAPYMMVAGQDEGFEDEYLTQNVRNIPALHYNALTDATGSQILPPPERNLASPPIDAMTTSIAVFTNFIRSTTGVPDAALGHVNPNDRSGKAVEALKASSEQSTSNYMDNLARAIRRAGEILVNLIPKVYDRPGRVLQIVDVDNEQNAVMVNAPFVHGKDGQPVAAPNGQPGMVVGQSPHPNVAPGAKVQQFDLAKGRYTVVVDVNKSFSTRRQEGMAAIGQLLNAEPKLAGVIGDLWVKDMDFPGAQAIAKRLEKMLPPPLQDQDGQQAAQQAQQLAQSGKMIDELTAHVNQLTQEIQTKQVENQAKFQIAQLDAQSRERVAEIQAAASMTNAQAKIDAENARTFIDAYENKVANLLELHMARLHKVLDQQHEAALTGAQHAHEAGLAALEHQHTLQQATQAAALQPTPDVADESTPVAE